MYESYQVKSVVEVADIIQNPSFLCGQADVIVAATKTDNIVFYLNLFF